MQGRMVGKGGLPEAMATIFVWLRYSSSRQLTWQRNYNTQPRILGEAQNRLTHAIAQVGCATAAPARPTADGTARLALFHLCIL